MRDGGLCGRSGGEKPGAEEDRLPLRAELTFYIFAFHVPIYGVMKEWSDTVPGFAWAMERSWLLPFLVAVLSTLLAIGLNGGAAWAAPPDQRRDL